MSPSQTTITQRGWDFHALRGSIDPGDLSLLPRVVRVVEVWREISSGDKALSFLCAAGPRRWPEGQLSPRAGSMSLIQSATSQWGWGFHTLKGGIDPGDLCSRPRGVGVVEIWRESSPQDKILSSLAAAGPRRWPEHSRLFSPPTNYGSCLAFFIARRFQLFLPALYIYQVFISSINHSIG